MSITSSGIGSGLDVNSIVTQLMTAERVPLDLLTAKTTSYNAKLSSYATLKSAVATFQSSLKALSADALGAQSATSSKPELLGVSAGANATAGQYAVTINTLAQAPQFISRDAGVPPTDTDATAKLGAGTLSIQIGGVQVVSIDGDYSLQGLSDAINAAKKGVSATVINDGTTNHLVISGNATGSANDLKITGTAGLLKFDSSGANMEPKQAAGDAELLINGILVHKPSNTITDAVSGLTLQLTKADAATTVTLSVAHDTATVKSAISGFIKAYNDLGKKVKDLTAYNAATKTGAALTGDQGATSIMTALRAELAKPVAGGSLTTLSAIGVTMQRDGTLAVDNTKLQAALDGNFGDVAKLFSSTAGYATRLDAASTAILGTDGVIAIHTNSLQNSIKSIKANQDSMQTRLDLTEKRLRAQFTALDATMAKMQSTSSYLTQQLAAITANNSTN